jgi:hypothetical protein
VIGKLVTQDCSVLDQADTTTVVNNLPHSFFRQCSVTLNGVLVLTFKNLYTYMAYLETILTYRKDAGKVI